MWFGGDEEENQALWLSCILTLEEEIEIIMDVKGVGRPTQLLLRVFVCRALSWSFDQFCYLCFCSGFSLEDFNMVTELSRHNFDLEVISDQFSDNWWILVALVS